ncbi:MAG: hypothetical protein L3J20_11685 [Flavobacteriaceae bacterium]|nr:hypothetical protein [Flavobacteriaceae bacterium]
MKSLLLFFIFLLMNSCSPKLRQSFSKVSLPEKTWVIFHPFKAKKAFLISKEAEKIKDSISALKIIGNDNNGGHLNAFKHSYWMARLTQGIGKRAAFSLGKAHEKGNYKTYKKHKLEDGFLPDKQSTDMDLFNNRIGINIGKSNKKTSKKELIQQLLDALHNGELRILKKDSLGNFLDCEYKIIPLDSLKGKWDTKKCLIKSSE